MDILNEIVNCDQNQNDGVEGVYIGDGREWDQFRINAFPSRAAFQVVVADPERQAGQFHREALGSLESSVTVSCAETLETDATMMQIPAAP